MRFTLCKIPQTGVTFTSVWRKELSCQQCLFLRNKGHLRLYNWQNQVCARLRWPKPLDISPISPALSDLKYCYFPWVGREPITGYHLHLVSFINGFPAGHNYSTMSPGSNQDTPSEIKCAHNFTFWPQVCLSLICLQISLLINGNNWYIKHALEKPSLTSIVFRDFRGEVVADLTRACRTSCPTSSLSSRSFSSNAELRRTRISGDADSMPIHGKKLRPLLRQYRIRV